MKIFKKNKKQKVQHHFQRYELKYYISAEQREIILNSIREYIVEDSYNISNKNINGYPITSLYLDAHDNLFYDQKIDGIEKRKKYRFRVYGDDLTKDKFFLEIKRKQDALSFKDRILVNKNEYEDLLGECLIYYNLDKKNKEDVPVLEEFLFDKYMLALRPVLNVFYFREAYFWESNKEVRLTFDHDITFSPYDFNDKEFNNIFEGIIFEIKIKGLMPFWLLNIIRKLNLEAHAFSKYCTGVDSIKGEMFYG